MDLDYDEIKMEPSLQTVCIVSVVHATLDAVGYKQEANTIWTLEEAQLRDKQIEREANERISKLQWPKKFKETAERFVMPILKELISWHYSYGFKTRPILTHYGTIDTLETTRVVLQDETLSRGYRFLIACCFCNEEHIEKLFWQLDEDDIKKCRDELSKNKRIDNEIASYLLKYFQGRNKQPIGECLSTRVCNQALLIAFLDGNDVAAKYLIPKATLEMLSCCISCFHSNKTNDLRAYRATEILPTTWAMLLSTACIVNNPALRNTATVCLHTSLLRYPYEKFFVTPLKSVIGTLETLTERYE